MPLFLHLSSIQPYMGDALIFMFHLTCFKDYGLALIIQNSLLMN